MRAPADARICRACGCWELRACEGGCSWLSADRCSACPDAALTLPIRAAHLLHARFEEKGVIKDETGADRLMGAVEFPALILVERSDKRGRLVGVRLFVGEEEMPDHDPVARFRAAERLNARRIAA